MKSPAPELRLGTRGSMLAMAQSRQVADALAAFHPELRVRLVPVITRGDRDQTTPLARVNDRDFFSAEIDTALLTGRVDFTVHSRKDLEGSRPGGIATVAIPARANPRDAVLFRPSVLDRLRRGERLRIGTSSARRAYHVARFLERALPQLNGKPDLRCEPLRGPVDQRLHRLHESGPDALDGVVLALAGLERLWQDPDGRAAIEPRLEGIRRMVLPLSRCPTAPGQGALAIECRADDAITRALLESLHHPETAADVAAEYAAASDPAGAAIATFGATALRVPQLGRLLFAAGEQDGTQRLQWAAPGTPASSRAWDGGQWHRACQHRPLAWQTPERGHRAVFVAHSRALSPARKLGDEQRVWVSGWQSWQRLSAGGLWIEGCADGLGFDALRTTLALGVLQLPPLDEWLALTRAGAESTWQDSGVGCVLGTYTLRPPRPQAMEQLRRVAMQATDFFWSSRDQYLALRECLPEAARHACGPGKTLSALRELGAQPRAFPSREAWQEWLA